jgi:hypothetical protein
VSGLNNAQSRHIENKHSNRDQSMIYLEGECSYIRGPGGGDSKHSTSVECSFSITPLPRPTSRPTPWGT